MERRQRIRIGLGVAAGLGLLLAVVAAYELGHRSSQPDSAPSPSPVALAPTATPVPECGLSAINRAAQSVVRVDTQAGSTGSGFFIDANTIVTAAHVVAKVSSVQLQLADGSNARGIVTSSSSLDVAVIRINRPQTGRGLEWRDTASVQAAEPILGVGFPLGTSGPPTVTRGTVSRIYAESNGVTYIQTDAGINPGNSGGPLIDECGKALGIVDLRRGDAEGIALAISARSAESEVRRLTGLSPLPPSLQGAGLTPSLSVTLSAPAPMPTATLSPSLPAASGPPADLAIGPVGGACPPPGSRLDLNLTNAGSTSIVSRRIRVIVTAADGSILWQNAGLNLSLAPGASVREATTAIALPPRITARVDFLDLPADPNTANNAVDCAY